MKDAERKLTLVTIRNETLLQLALDVLAQLTPGPIGLQFTKPDGGPANSPFRPQRPEETRAWTTLRVQGDPSLLAGLQDRYEGWISDALLQYMQNARFLEPPQEYWGKTGPERFDTCLSDNSRNCKIF